MNRFVASAVVAACVFAATPARAQDATPGQVARQFYDAFCKGDTATMENLYAPDVKWKDTIFSFDDRAGTMGMWDILCKPAPDKKFTYKMVSVSGDTVVVHWLADYVLLGRKIHNDVMATLVVKNGKIVSHEDVYDWGRWARQAFPLGGLVDVWPVKPVLMGVLRLFMHVQIALSKPSPTKGVTGALSEGAAAR
jgi:ketosteroid isomerase-like protein